jgi:hypothetical protein
MDNMPLTQGLLFPDSRPLVERLGRTFFRQLPERPRYGTLNRFTAFQSEFGLSDLRNR